MSLLKLDTPYVGQLYRKLYLSRIADNLSTLLSSGVSMVRALEITQSVVDNAVSGFVELGRRLIEAKSGLPHGQWQVMIDEKLEFSVQTARRFMRIAKWVGKNQTIHGVDVLELLPPDSGTIDMLTRLEPQALERFVKDKTISPKLGRHEVGWILKAEKVKADENRILKIQPRPGKYRTIVIDPAWEYDVFSEKAKTSIPYAKQSIEELEKLNLRGFAEPECHLYCWSTNAYVAKACKLIEHWGFEFKGVLTWVKPPPFGLGRNFRNSTEQVLFAMLGDWTTRVNNLPTHFEGSRGEHSEKPESFYEIVRLASYPPYGEANQRKLRPDFADLFMEGEPLKAAV